MLSALRSTTDHLSYVALRRLYADRVGRSIAYSTLRERLDELKAAGLITSDPRKRLPNYWAVTLPSAPSTSDKRPIEHGVEPTRISGDTDDAHVIPLAADARHARELLMRHASARRPSTYTAEFLDAYRPGTTWYLPQSLRASLRELGRTTYADQPAGTYARDIMQRLIIDLSWGSSRLEGNKYTRIDTEELIHGGRDAEGASNRDRQMILNHKAAIEFLVENAADIAFDRYTLMSLHGLLAENLLQNRDDEGRLRTSPVTIGASLFTPTAIPQVIDERFNALLHTAAAIVDPMEQSFFAMVHLPYLQPFIDVNKRTSRLAANIPLIKANLCPLSFVDVPETLYAQGTLAVYELRDVSLLRDVFAWAYERSCQQFKVLREAMGEPDPIRLRYRVQLRALVTAVVEDMHWPDAAELAARAAQLEVPTLDREHFIAAAWRDLLGLRPEVLARYQLRPSQYERWKADVASRRGEFT